MGAGEGLEGPGDDGDDLGVEDRRAIERHLADCPECCAHREAMGRALGVLTAAAGAMPAIPDAPSVWPALERRIAGRDARAGEPGRARKRSPAEGAATIWASLDDDRALRSAWAQDTLRELAEAVGWGGCRVRKPSGRRRVPGRPWRAARASLAASVMLLIVVLPLTWRLRAGAEAKMQVYAEPVPMVAGPPAPPEWSTDDEAPSIADNPEPERRQLAQAGPLRPPTEPARAVEPAGRARPDASRFDYDLEHGTPMPPDGRDARPIY